MFGCAIMKSQSRATAHNQKGESMYKLINEKTGKEVTQGETVVNFRGEEAQVISATPPHKPSSTGRVNTDKGSFFPSVYGLKFISL